jgi:hypothetical protein
MEVKRTSNGWAKILLNPGETSTLLRLLDKACKSWTVGFPGRETPFDDGSTENFLPNLRARLNEILPDLRYGDEVDVKYEADRIARYSGTWWDHLWGKTPWGREQIRKTLEKGPHR